MDDVQWVIKLTQSVKKYPMLYDISSEEYNNKAEQEKAWKSVSEEVKLNVATCKEKWRNLRAGLSRHIRNQQLIGSGAKPKKPYYLAEYMDFVIPFSKPRKLFSHFDGGQIGGQTCESSEDVLVKAEDDVVEPVQIAECTMEENDSYLEENHVDGLYTDDLLHKRDKNEDTSRRNTVKRKWKDQYPVEKCALEYLAAKESRSEREGQEDADLNFLKSLLPDLRQMNRRQKNKFKIAVIRASDSILCGDEDKNNQSTPNPSTPYSYGSNTSASDDIDWTR